jgi:hypothetical protein
MGWAARRKRTMPSPKSSKSSKSSGDVALINAVTKHVMRWVGPITCVFHEHVSELVHVDLHYVASTGDRPFEVLVTSGMAERPMTTPAGEDVAKYAEVLTILPAGWPLYGPALEDERNYWPLQMLKDLARYPHQHDTWLGAGHSLNDGEGRGKPFAPNTRLSSIILLVSRMLPEEFHILHGPGGREIHFLLAVPLYWEELQLKLRDGTLALLDAFEAHGVTECIDPHRTNVALCSWRGPGARHR